MKKSILSFIAVMLVIGLLGLAAVFGFSVGGKLILPSIFDGENGIRRGLDLVGGSSITYEANLPEGYDTNNLTADMDAVQSMLTARLTSLGYTEATVALQGESRVTVEIPAIKNPEEAVQTLGQTAQLKFYNAAGEEILNGTDVKKATAKYGDVGSGFSENYVELVFQAEAKTKWVEATKAAASGTDGTNFIAIMMDGQVVSAPSVDSKYASTGINSDTCVISGSFTAETAGQLANQINIGQLPFTLTQDELRSVGPELGSDALRNSFLATIIGTILVCIFMIFMYRLPGFIAVIALGFYMVIEAILLALFHVNLSLPGIAGIVLSIGMAVDANVVIFERVKEELRAGKSVKAAIDSGFKRAFTAILDSNVTTLIAAGVLLWLGTGTIVGFGMTLGLGILISMFTALTVTHFLLNRMVDFRIKNPKIYGA